MQAVFRAVPAVVLALLSSSAFALTTTYTSSAAFLSDVAAGSYTNTFDGLANPAPAAYAGGGFAYTVTAPNDIYASGNFLGVNQENDALTVTLTGSTVTAIGANFFATDLGDDFQPVSITVTLSDGTVETFTPTSAADSFRGFISTAAISSLVISGAGTSLYSGMDNLTVGVSAVPEPASWLMGGLGLAAILLARRRKA